MQTTHLAITLLFPLETGFAQILELKIAGVLLFKDLILAIKKEGEEQGKLSDMMIVYQLANQDFTRLLLVIAFFSRLDTCIILNRNEIQPALHLPNLANQH